jgi:hypothetical protein
VSDFSSNAGQIGLALVNVVKNQQPEGVADEEVALREDWLSGTGDPYPGISIVYQGEQYSEGTIGTQDIGYLYGIVFVKYRTGDAVLPDDLLMSRYEKVRRRLMDQRVIGPPLVADSTVAQHVSIVMPGKTLTNVSKWPNYLIRMLVVAVWLRELPTTSGTETD